MNLCISNLDWIQWAVVLLVLLGVIYVTLTIWWLAGLGGLGWPHSHI